VKLPSGAVRPGKKALRAWLDAQFLTFEKKWL
jgi:hypothetical protein